jgi:hypothetical protein
MATVPQDQEGKCYYFSTLQHSFLTRLNSIPAAKEMFTVPRPSIPKQAEKSEFEDETIN